jgi:probable F420-dependent oxidoreductase
MRISLGLPVHRVDLGPELMSGRAIATQARAAEAAGFDAVFVTDHPFPGEDWLAHGGHHALDPLVALSFAAAATTSLRLHTNLYIAAYRNPFVSAKAVASLDALSDGRVILGIGAGYLEPEFAALGVDFADRNDLTDEAIIAMKEAWTGERVVRSGRSFDAPGNRMLPRPVQRPHPPIWIGGNSRRAIRRAVELADGWAPMPNPARSARRRHSPPLETLEDLRASLAYAAAHAAEVGRRAPLEVVFMPLGLDMLSDGGFDGPAVVDHLGLMADAGVTYACVSLGGETLNESVAETERFGQTVIGKLAG